MIEAEQLHARILARLDMTRDMEDEELTELIYEVLQEASQEEYLPLDQKTMLGKELFNAFRKLDLLQEFLEDEQITEIMINGTQNIFIEKAGRIIPPCNNVYAFTFRALNSSINNGTTSNKSPTIP